MSDVLSAVTHFRHLCLRFEARFLVSVGSLGCDVSFCLINIALDRNCRGLHLSAQIVRECFVIR